MIEFKPITTEDFDTVSPILKRSGIENCEHCFATMLVWAHRHPVEISVTENTVFMRSAGDKHTWYLYPRGEMDPVKAINLIIQDARRRGSKISIYGIDRAGAEILQKNFSDVFDITEDRNGADYIYNSRDLIDLPGKKYQKKRNHCSRFVRENPDYKFIPITTENVQRAKDFEISWCQRYNCDNGRDLASEQQGIMQLLNNFDKMDLMGAMIETGGQIVAMSIAAPINERMVDVMIEKAYHDVNGAYAVINRDFAANCFGDFMYINREDDMGVENLRKAKLSYYPCEIKSKFLAQSK